MHTVIVATSFEAEFFNQGLTQVSPTFYQGNFRLAISGPGVINMAKTCENLTQKFPNDIFVNVGIAGCFGSSQLSEVCTISNYNMLHHIPFPCESQQIVDQSYPTLNTGFGRSIFTSVTPVWNTDNLNLPDGSLIDMEAYAFAKVCHDNHVSFQCFKAISDHLQKQSQQAFLNNAKIALQKLQTFVFDNIVPS